MHYLALTIQNIVDIISDLQFFCEFTHVMYNNIKISDLYLLLGKYFQFNAYSIFHRYYFARQMLFFGN